MTQYNKSHLRFFLILLVCSIYIVGCGQGVQDAASSPPKPPRSKPETIAQDSASSAHAIFVLSAFSFLHRSLKTALEGGKDRPCREVGIRESFPNRSEQTSTQARLVMNNTCEALTGAEDIMYSNLRRRPNGPGYLFERATLNTVLPLQLTLNSGHLLLVQHQLLFELTSVAHVYKFDLSSKWATRTTPEKQSDLLLSEWQTHLSGKIQMNTAHDLNVTLTELVITDHLELQSPAESSSLHASAVSKTALMDTCGHPQTQWQGVYLTTLFPSQTLNLDFKSFDRKFENLTLGETLFLPQCKENTWAQGAILGQSLIEQVRSK